MAVWRRKPKDRMLIHSDPPVHQHASFLTHHNLVQLEADAALP